MYALLQLFAVFVGTMAVAMAATMLVVYANLARANWRKLLICSAIHGGVMVLLLVVWFNARPGFFDKNMLAFDVLTDLRGDQRPDPLADQQVGLVLIDNARNKTTVPPKRATAMGQEKVAITDRTMLAELFRFLAAHQDKVGLVVCDITFEDASSDDQELADAIIALDRYRKILLAQGQNENTEALRFGQRMMGRVTESLQGNMVAAHQLVLNGQRSLPCLMYERTTGAELGPAWIDLFLCEQGGPDPGLRYSAFPAALDRFDDRCTQPPHASGGEVDITTPPYLPKSLGAAISESGKEELLLALAEQTPDPARLPIVFIGEFSTLSDHRSGTDVHNTLRGRSQGSTLLIDLYLELMAGAHHVRGLSLFMAWLLFTLLSFTLFSKPWAHWPWHAFKRGTLAPLSPPDKRDATPQQGEKASAAPVWRAFRRALIDQTKAQFPLFVFLFCFVGLALWLDIHLNLAAFFLYFLLLNLLCSKVDLSSTATDTHHKP